MAKDELLPKMLAQQMKEERLIAAICAAPVFVLANNNLLKNVESVVCHPSVLAKLEDKSNLTKFVTSPNDDD